jgi:nucleoside-diphosphate-sugar epimerase
MKVFVTGASGYIGSAVVKELLKAGHEVLGLARSDKSAAALKAAGVTVLRGSLEDLESLKNGASKSDGVIHTAFVHDFSNFVACCQIDRRAIETIGSVLENTNHPFVIASGLAGLNPGGIISEDIVNPTYTMPSPRIETERILLEMASRGIRTVSVRLPPTVHGPKDHGFIDQIIKVAKAKSVSAYVGDGNNHWPAVHYLDAAKVFHLALEKAPSGGTVVHAVGEEKVPFKEIARVVSERLKIPLVSIPKEDAINHFGFLGNIVTLDTVASTEITRKLLGWKPTQPELLSDIKNVYEI